MTISFEAEVTSREILIDIENELDKVKPNIDILFSLSNNLYDVLASELVDLHNKVKNEGVRMMAEFFRQQRLLGNE